MCQVFSGKFFLEILRQIDKKNMDWRSSTANGFFMRKSTFPATTEPENVDAAMKGYVGTVVKAVNDNNLPGAQSDPLADNLNSATTRPGRPAYGQRRSFRESLLRVARGRGRPWLVD
jgi:hypothetical protein